MKELGSRDWDVVLVVQLPPTVSDDFPLDAAIRLAPLDVVIDRDENQLRVTGELLGLSYRRVHPVLEEIYYKLEISSERIVELSVKARE